MTTNYRRLAYLAHKLDEIIMWDLISESYRVSEVWNYQPRKIEVMT